MMKQSVLAASAVMMACAPEVVLGAPIETKGITPYVTHFIFRPVENIDIAELGTATLFEAFGTTQNMKGEKMFDKMSAHCKALNVASGDKKCIDGACVLTDSDGDKVFSTFDTRDLDKSQPEMDCGTHIITGGTGKYAGITGREPFACIEPARTGWFRWLYRDGHPAQHDLGDCYRTLVSVTASLSANQARLFALLSGWGL